METLSDLVARLKKHHANEIIDGLDKYFAERKIEAKASHFPSQHKSIRYFMLQFPNSSDTIHAYNQLIGFKAIVFGFTTVIFLLEE